ncbi:MAG: 3-oxoacyl-ACP reductase FabG [Oscillospiraceae bacterium]|nr:3-oxoacyl-ACP reductase FabG [Oscillospiraceae bacterium]
MNVIITGATGGIGKGLAIAFAKASWSLGLVYHKNEHAATELVKILDDTYGVKAIAVQADVANHEQVNTAFEQCREFFGRNANALINNAGIARQRLFTDISPNDWQEMLGVNLTGVFNCCKAVLPGMIAQKSGTIVNISSMWGPVGASCEVDYSAAKAGVIGLTKALAKEVAPSNINVNCSAPGVVETDMLSGFASQELEQLRSEIPLGRFATPKDIAQVALFLSSPMAAYITGQVLGVNGGMVI